MPRKPATYGPATFQPESRNPKLGPIRVGKGGGYIAVGPFVCSTHATIETCPDTCIYKHQGCYAEANDGAVKQMERAAKRMGLSPTEVNEYETMLLDSAFGGRAIPQDGGRHGDRGRDLRLHVAGDFADEQGAKALAEAAERWRSRGGGIVWSYTHRPTIPRDVFGGISILRSCETSQELIRAADEGFGAAMTVPDFPDGPRAFPVPGTGLTAIPCPKQINPSVPCVQCRLCMNADKLRARGLVVAFRLHGRDVRKAREALDGKLRLPILHAQQPDQELAQVFRELVGDDPGQEG